LTQNSSTRRSRAYVSEFSTTLLHLKNPWNVAFWSFAFPGCGHLMQGRLAKGLLLIIWELIANTNAKVNLGIMYTLNGQFDKAKQVINTRWVLLYLALYVFAMWDSYRGTVDLNKLYILADREDVPIKAVIIKTLDTNFLDKRSPWLSAVLSVLTPGLGHLYVHKVITGLFFIAWTIMTIYLSHGLQAVHYTLTGYFSQSKSILDMQWLMYLPSIYGFVVYDAYTSTVEYNKLFEKAQSRFLRDNYQRRDFKMPL
jgi:hypothetical protein